MHLSGTTLASLATTDSLTTRISHSRFHELWSLRLCTGGSGATTRALHAEHDVRDVPVPGWPETEPARRQLRGPPPRAIAVAARRLVELRDRWLNPPEWVDWGGAGVSPRPPRRALGSQHRRLLGRFVARDAERLACRARRCRPRSGRGGDACQPAISNRPHPPAVVRGARLPQALAALAAGLAPGHGRRRDRGRGRRGAAAPRFCPRGAAHDVLPKGGCWRARVVGLRPARCLPRSSTPVVVAPPSHGPGPRAAQDGGASFHGALQAQRGGRSCTWADVEFTDGDDGQSSRCAARPTGPTSRPTSGGSLVAARLRSAVCTRRRRLGRRRSAGRKSAPKAVDAGIRRRHATRVSPNIPPAAANASPSEAPSDATVRSPVSERTSCVSAPLTDATPGWSESRGSSPIAPGSKS